MDPWLELHWGDVHHRLVQYAGDALQTRLPEDLFARVEERDAKKRILAITRPF